MSSWPNLHAPKTTKDLPVHSSKLKVAREWLSQIGNHALDRRLRVLVVCGGSGVGKSSMIRLLCSELNIAVTEWNDSCFDDVKFSDENAALHLTEGVTDKSTPGVSSQYPSLTFSTAAKRTPPVSASGTMLRVLLLRDAELMNSLSQQLRKMTCPVVILLSGVNSSTDMSFAINQIIDKETQALLSIQQLYVTPVVKTKLLGILSNVADAEIVKHRNQYKIRLCKPSRDVLEDICEASNGDVRHALMQLQYVMLGQSSTKDSKMISVKGMDNNLGSLDGLETIMHATLDANSRLQWKPEELLTCVDFPIDMSLSFLQHNCISHMEFMSLRRQRKAAEKCIDEPPPEEDSIAAIERALNYYSEAEILWQRQFDTSQLVDLTDRVFPLGYVSGICGRASAVAMHNPLFTEETTKSKREFFLPMNRPKGLDAWQKQGQMRNSVARLRNALSPYSNQLLTYNNVAVEILPYMRSLVTNIHYHQSMPSSIRLSMQSIVFQTSSDNSSSVELREDAPMDNNAIASILEVDDISSFSDSD